MKEGDKNQLVFLAEKLFNNFKTYAPINADERLLIAEITDPLLVNWSGKLPENSWKLLLLPPTEKLFDHSGSQIKETEFKIEPTVFLGVNILDLRALALLDLVFSNDKYYQRRRREILIVGFSNDWPNGYKKLKLFSHNYEEDILEHVPFDIFVAQIKDGKLKFYSGSEKGQKILESYGIKKFDHIEFAGAIPEAGPDKRMTLLMDKVGKSADKRLWQDLGKICLACGKCSSVCPTCYCFDLSDKSDVNNCGRERRWGNCFYNDFSKVAGGHKDLDTVAKKIYFWYVHKFVRIPFGYRVPGCVSCGRCAKACSVGIDITKNISALMKGK